MFGTEKQLPGKGSRQRIAAQQVAGLKQLADIRSRLVGMVRGCVDKELHSRQMRLALPQARPKFDGVGQVGPARSTWVGRKVAEWSVGQNDSLASLGSNI